MQAMKLTWKVRWGLALFIALGVWLLMQPLTAWACGGGVICVDVAASSPTPDGQTWETAYPSLQTALTAASAGNEIWVAEGVYKPSTTGNRAQSFTINKNITLYGGFPASGNPTMDDRDPTLYPTVLSGDLAGDDTTDANGVVLDWMDIVGTDNSYHVITMASPGSAVLDGFVVTGGNASSSTFPNSSGGGLFDYSGGGYTLRNMVFRGNRSYAGGGASFFYNNSGTVTVQDASFIGNSGLQGGAMSILNTTLNLTRVLFQENDAVVTGGTAGRIGGAILGGGGSTPYDSTHPLTLTDVQFIANTAAGSNSAIYFQYGTATLTNALFQGNNDLGSWPNAFGSDYSALTLTNVVFAGNRGHGLRTQLCHSTLTNVTASGNGNYGISLTGGTLAVRNSIVYGNASGSFSLSSVTPTINDSLVQGGCPGGAACTHVINANPTFVTPITAAAPTTSGDLRLRAFSPAIDAGDNTVVTPTLPATDLDGRTRRLDDLATADTGNGSAPIVDMGAYEFAGPTLVTEIHQASDDSIITTAPISTTIYGKATVYGVAPTGTPAGTVTLYLYDNATCTGTPLAAETQTLLADGTARSSNMSARSFYYQVTYAGDGNYAPVTSGCTLFSAYQPGPIFTVNTTADDNLDNVCSDIHCTLREAINAANDTAGDNTILFGVGDGQTLVLASALPGFSALTGAATIDGESHALTISGNDAARVFKVNSNAQVTLANLTITEGRDTSSECEAHTCGGGLKVDAGAAVTLTHNMLVSNTAYYGGGIYNAGTLQVLDSTLAGNSATVGGGGFYNAGGTVTVNASTLAGNRTTHASYAGGYGGGGLYNNGGNLTVQNSTLADNAAPYNSGGGLYNAGTTTVRASTLSGNAADYGGGIWNASGALSLVRTIVANSGAGHDCNLAGGSASSLDSMFEATGWDACSLPADYNTLLGVDPSLGPLADNGGSTLTFALLPNSPAIDAVRLSTCFDTDQRGEARDDLGCDIGAYELKYADSDTVIRPVKTSLTTFGPTLAGMLQDTGYADPGVITVTKATSWASQGPESIGAWWAITPTVTSGFSLTLRLCYTDAELGSLTEDDLRFWRYDGAAWTQVGDAPVFSTVNGYHCAALNGVGELSIWTLATSQPTAISLRTFSAVTQPGRAGLLIGMMVLVGGITVLWRKRK